MGGRGALLPFSLPRPGKGPWPSGSGSGSLDPVEITRAADAFAAARFPPGSLRRAGSGASASARCGPRGACGRREPGHRGANSKTSAAEGGGLAGQIVTTGGAPQPTLILAVMTICPICGASKDVGEHNIQRERSETIRAALGGDLPRCYRRCQDHPVPKAGRPRITCIVDPSDERVYVACACGYEGHQRCWEPWEPPPAK